MWAVLLRVVSLPARDRPIRECLSISVRNLAAFPHPAERERERERERGGEGKNRWKERERQRESHTWSLRLRCIYRMPPTT